MIVHPTNVTIFVLVSILASSYAIVTTPNMLEHRSKTSDFEYNLDLSNGNERKAAGNYSARILNMVSAPILAMKDVQSSVEYVELKINGSSDGTHYHPRSAEVCYVENGNVTATLMFVSGTNMSEMVEIKNANCF